jgi:hypothetical protein
LKTKISSDFWSHPEIENSNPETRLAALWLMTNERVTLFGYAEITDRRFAFETGLSKEALTETLRALGNTFVQTSKGYWIRNYIKDQFGSGDALRANNMGKAVAKALAACGDKDVIDLVESHYPEFQKQPNEALAKPLASSTQVQRVRVGVRVGESVSVRAGVSAKAPTGILPAEQPQGIHGRMLTLNRCKGRKDSTRWSAKEWAAFKATGLDTCTLEIFEEQVPPVVAFYEADLSELRRFWGKPDVDFRRRDLLTLLNNWSGEVDRANDFAKFISKSDSDRASGRL